MHARCCKHVCAMLVPGGGRVPPRQVFLAKVRPCTNGVSLGSTPLCVPSVSIMRVSHAVVWLHRGCEARVTMMRAWGLTCSPCVTLRSLTFSVAVIGGVSTWRRVESRIPGCEPCVPTAKSSSVCATGNGLLPLLLLCRSAPVCE
jgi:hypothetical protein